MTQNTTGIRWLGRFAWLTAMMTWLLIGLGGLVTSKGVGMSVPDWPTTYGYNMFLFPISQWAGGIFYEHTHRLFASLVGLLTAVLTAWVWVREGRGWPRAAALGFVAVALGLMGVRTQGMFIAMAALSAIGAVGCIVMALRDEQPLRWWVGAAFCAVIVQGVLGGLRVTAMEDAIGMVHGTLAQLFLILVTVIALCLSPFWSDLKTRAREVRMSSSIRWVLLATTFAILGQLMLGAAMRHQHAGLAIPDFPLAHGALYPATDTDSLATYNAQRLDHREFNDIRALDIHLHMAHRFTAVLVTVLMTVSVVLLIRSLDGRFPGVRRLAIVWFGLLVFQLGLGVVTVLKNKPADIATLHVMIGALCLVVGAVLVRISREFSVATKMAVLQSPARSVSGATPETAQ